MAEFSKPSGRSERPDVGLFAEADPIAAVQLLKLHSERLAYQHPKRVFATASSGLLQQLAVGRRQVWHDSDWGSGPWMLEIGRASCRKEF